MCGIRASKTPRMKSSKATKQRVLFSPFPFPPSPLLLIILMIKQLLMLLLPCRQQSHCGFRGSGPASETVLKRKRAFEQTKLLFFQLHSNFGKFKLRVCLLLTFSETRGL
jgi:hypothetical protein